MGFKMAWRGVGEFMRVFWDFARVGKVKRRAAVGVVGVVGVEGEIRLVGDVGERRLSCFVVADNDVSMEGGSDLDGVAFVLLALLLMLFAGFRVNGKCLEFSVHHPSMTLRLILICKARDRHSRCLFVRIRLKTSADKK
jgi:hypothetical protein